MATAMPSKSQRSEGHRILELAYAFREAKVLLSAIELGVFRTLADGPLDCNELRTRLGLHSRGARDFLDALVALELLQRDDAGYYGNTEAAERFLVLGGPSYLGGLLQHLNTREYPCWSRLPDALRTGDPQFRNGGADHYQELYADPADVADFARAMSGGSLLLATELANHYAWERHNTFIDIGCAEGCLPVQLAERHPHLTGGGFDLPAIAPSFNSYVQKHGLSDRLRFHAGDFLTDPLPGADVLIMGRVLHNWDLPIKKMLLDKAHAALEPASVLIVYERLIDDERRVSASGLLASLNMLVMTKGGFDYSAADCMSWMREAGFRSMSIVPLTPDQSAIIAIK